MRDKENIEALSVLKPDFIGFIFHEKSSRNITEPLAINLPDSISKVGVFVNKSIEFISDKADQFNLNYIQLHGNESPEFCKKLKKQLNIGVIKAFNISDDFKFNNLEPYEPFCDYFLFDAFGKQAGGNGITFNWTLLEQYTEETPFLLSGGINETMADNIKQFQHQKCIGIDINSGFEISPAMKNINKIKVFKNELYS